MKIKHILASMLLAGFAALGLAAGLKSANAEKALADSPATISYIDLRGSYDANPSNNWETSGAKFAVCYQQKENEVTIKEAWSDLAISTSTDHVYSFEVPELDFVPNKTFLIRLSDKATEGSWDYKWNQAEVSHALGAEVFTVGADFDSASSYGSVVINGGVNPWSETTLSTPLTNIQLNGAGQWEFYGDVVIPGDYEIKFYVYGTAYDGKFTNNSPLTGIVSGNQKDNIRINAAGTYKMYYNVSTYTLHITTQAIIEADAYAQYFINNVGCDVSGETAPTGWATVKSEFESDHLSNAGRMVLVEFDNPNNEGDAIQRCTFLYDLAVKQHSELDQFMKYKDSYDADVIRQVSLLRASNIQVQADSTTYIIIIAIAATSVAALGTLLILKKKRK